MPNNTEKYLKDQKAREARYKTEKIKKEQAIKKAEELKSIFKKTPKEEIPFRNVDIDRMNNQRSKLF